MKPIFKWLNSEPYKLTKWVFIGAVALWALYLLFIDGMLYYYGEWLMAARITTDLGTEEGTAKGTFISRIQNILTFTTLAVPFFAATEFFGFLKFKDALRIINYEDLRSFSSGVTKAVILFMLVAAVYLFVIQAGALRWFLVLGPIAFMWIGVQIIFSAIGTKDFSDLKSKEGGVGKYASFLWKNPYLLLPFIPFIIVGQYFMFDPAEGVGLVLSVFLTLIFLGIIVVTLIKFFGDDGKEHIRGGQLVKPEKYLESFDAKYPKGGNLSIGDMPLPPENETLNTIITASIGAGKSVSIRKLLIDLRKRGDRVIIVDNGYEFYETLGKPDDLVMTPLGGDVGWSIKNEVSAPHEWARIASSVVPDGHGNAAEWRKMAQDLLADVGVSVGAECTNKQLYEILTVDTPEQLAPVLKGTASGVLLQDGGQRLLTNIRSVFGNYIKAWQYAKEGDFSFRDYMMGDDNRWLWLPFKESEFTMTRGMIATWLDVLVMAGLERKEGQSPRTWIVIDELDTLGKLNSLIPASTRLRKRNVALVAACQSFSQLEEHYGKEGSQTLLNCFSNTLALRCVDSDMAEIMSLRLGEQEVWQKSYNNNSSGGSTSSEAKVTKRIVMASEIQNLADLTGFFKAGGDWPVVSVKVTPPPR